jgi:hypothetical protein
MNSAQLAICTFSLIVVLIASVAYWRKSLRDTSSQLKEEQERKRHPLSKLEIAARQAERRKEKENADD